MDLIHGHKILKLINQNDFSSIDELKLKIKEKFSDKKFTNCSKKEYSCDEILDFFISKNKIVISNDRISLKLDGCSCSF